MHTSLYNVYIFICQHVYYTLPNWWSNSKIFLYKFICNQEDMFGSIRWMLKSTSWIIEWPYKSRWCPLNMSPNVLTLNIRTRKNIYRYEEITHNSKNQMSIYGRWIRDLTTQINPLPYIQRMKFVYFYCLPNGLKKKTNEKYSSGWVFLRVSECVCVWTNFRILYMRCNGTRSTYILISYAFDDNFSFIYQKFNHRLVNNSILVSVCQ